MQTIAPNSPDQISKPFRDEEGQPDVGAMRAQLLFAAEQAVGEINRQTQNENTRFCRWAAQREDGRKPDGPKVKPYGGASDVRVRLADGFILDDVALLTTAAREGRLSIQGTHGGVMADAAKTGLYLDWLRGVKMQANVEREIMLAAEGRQTYGYMVMAVKWVKAWARDYEVVTVEGLQRAAVALAQGYTPDENTPEAALRLLTIAPMLPDLFVVNADTQRACVALMRAAYPDLERGEAYRQLRELRSTGEMKLPVRYLRVNEPVWQCLRPWRDWFGPLNTFDAQSARWHCEREVLTAQQLDAKRVDPDWAGCGDFIDAVRGTMGFSVINWSIQRGPSSGQPYRDRMEEMRGLCELFTLTYWHTDEQGVPCLYRTVFSPWLDTQRGHEGEGLTGPDGPLNYDCACYPYVFLPLEMPDRYLVDSRGRPEVLGTQQVEVKHMRDARINQTDMALQPPLIRPEREIGLPLTVKPRGEIGFRRTGQTAFMPVPQQAQGAGGLENEALQDARRYLARDREIDPVRVAAREKAMVAGWCAQLAECWLRTLQLSQQFADEVEFQRVVGGSAQTIRVSRADIQGNPNLKLTFNVDTLDPERMESKVKMFALLNSLNDGTVKGGPILAEFTQHYFPEVAEAALRTGEQADAHEIKDTADILGRILGAGIEPDYAEDGQNFQLRLQWLQQQVAQPATQQSMAQSPDKATLVQKYAEHLAFMVSQKTDQAQAGRTGVSPAPVSAPTRAAA
jgi:hypothetical protein